jgi:hypothetical protein
MDYGAAEDVYEMVGSCWESERGSLTNWDG